MEDATIEYAKQGKKQDIPRYCRSDGRPVVTLCKGRGEMKTERRNQWEETTMTTMTDKEMAEELWELAHYLGRDGKYHKTLKKIARRLDPLSVIVPVTEAHVGCPVVRKFSAGALLFPRDTDPEAFIHPDRYKIAITHRHDESPECPVDPDDFVIVEHTDGTLVGTERPEAQVWRNIMSYSVIDVVPLQEVGDET